eukprot:6593173-Pyramimonas_sp.AAC.1
MKVTSTLKRMAHHTARSVQASRMGSEQVASEDRAASPMPRRCLADAGRCGVRCASRRRL